VLDHLRDVAESIADAWHQLTPRTRQHIVVAAGVVGIYVVLAPIVAALVFPPHLPPPSDAPRIGAMMVQHDIKSTFVFRRTSADTGGAYVELDLLMDAGGGPGNAGAHVHPDIEEQLQVLDGAATVRVGRTERVYPAGSRVVIPRGVAHAIRNASDGFVLVRERFTPAANLDAYYVQVDRAGGFGGAGRTRMAVLSTWFDQQYPAGLPIWMTRLGTLFLTPTARLAGVRTYYPPA
jgi:mannose-6-phosphate isomerase-like protein (cupin superfamily)